MNGEPGSERPEPTAAQPTGERLDRAKDLLRQAAEAPTAATGEWVRQQTADDPELGEYVLRLLRAATRPASDFAGVRAAAAEFVGSRRPERVGRYRIVDTLGEGGMGTVYLAEQDEPVRRRVALKLIKLGMDSRAVVARFDHERQALAMMEHDGIAKVFDCGTSERGQPFFVMEFVGGAPLVEHCERLRLDLAQRIELLLQVCDAVQHAHQKGVVHRDLKPGNVLVANDGSGPRVKVIDFGLAKAVHQKWAEATMVTMPGQVVGTIEYMAPEQLDPAYADVDTRADVYSLGVMLYELLVGALPFVDSQLRALGLLELQRVLQDVDPPRPSERFAAHAPGERERLATLRRTSPAALARALVDDLDWVVLRAMEKDRKRRYPTVGAFADDLRRFLQHEPLSVARPTTWQRLRKYARRNRRQVVTLAAVLATAVVGASVAITFAISATRLAQEKGELALAESDARQRADAAAQRLGSKVREFDLLAGVVQHERLLATARDLYPPWPQRIERIEHWLEHRLRPLLSMRPDIEATIADLRSRALARTDADRDGDRRSHPQYRLFLQLEGFAAALDRAAAVRAGGKLEVPNVSATHGDWPPKLLMNAAAERFELDPARRTVIGEEARGLALAQLAADKSVGTAEHADALAMLAWGWFVSGDHAQARRTAEQAVAVARGASRKSTDGLLEKLDAEIVRVDELDAAARADLERVRTQVDQQRSFRFETDAQLYLHDALTRLVQDLDEVDGSLRVEIERRLAWAQTIGELGRAHPNAAVSWAEARAAIAAADGSRASELYRGWQLPLADEDVVGLVPIGRNPATGLWEFYDLRSAWDGEQDPATLPIPRHAQDGSIDVDDATGIVFVLVPGGRFVMGAQSDDPSAANYEQDAQWYVKPAHEVALEPFLLARHELTQTQWARLCDGDERADWPSEYRAGTHLVLGESMTGAHPVSGVDWKSADRVLRELGMTLPTEAQWEYACRAGTTTPFWCGPELYADVMNVADQHAKAAGANWNAFSPFDDGYTAPSPVDVKRANPWGFVGMHGNLQEWCLDALAPYVLRVRSGDGLRAADGEKRIARGANFRLPLLYARASQRTPYNPASSYGDVGLRVARSLRPLVRHD